MEENKKVICKCKKVVIEYWVAATDNGDVEIDGIDHTKLSEGMMLEGVIKEDDTQDQYKDGSYARSSTIRTWLQVDKTEPIDSDKSDVSSDPYENIKEFVLKEYEEGNIVVSTFDGLQTVSLKEFVKQPVDGMLYDLNRNETTVLTFIKDPKWVNDYAVAKVIQELKRQLDERTS